MATPVFLVTGSSSGFGKAIASEALRRGYKVVATCRDSSKLTALKEAGAAVLDLDVTASDDELAAKLKAVRDIYGSLTHVVNAAGYVLEGTVEECSQAEVAAIFATNVYGAAGTARAAAPHLREAAKAGQQTALASFGSLASWSTAAVVSVYSATKAAVSLLMLGVRQELEPFGIDVTVIEPGYFRTELLNAGRTDAQRKVTARLRLPVYEDNAAVTGTRKALMAADNRQLGDAEKGARVIVDVLTRTGSAKGRKPPTRMVLGSDCVDAVRKVMADTEAELKEWETVLRSTDHE